MALARPQSLPRLTAALLVACSVLASAQQPAHTAKPRVKTAPGGLAAQIRTITASRHLARTRWGISVTTLDGAPIYALHDDELFQPASNVKLFTTSAALALLPPTRTWQTTLTAAGNKTAPNTLRGSITIASDGDAFLSTRVMPYSPDQTLPTPSLAPLDALASQLADKLHAAGISTVDGDLIARDLLPAQPYARGVEYTDLPWAYAAPVTGLILNDNELRLTVTPAAALHQPAHLELTPSLDDYLLADRVATVPGRRAVIAVSTTGRTITVSGRIGLHAAPDDESIAILDPQSYIAVALKHLLIAHGINVTGTWSVEHGPPPATAILRRTDSAYFSVAHTSPPLLDDVVLINKTSLNLHADLLLRHLPDNSASVHSLALSAGITPGDVTLFDGSGLSTLDRATPRAFTSLLRYANSQPWVTNFKSSLPVAGVDGTLKDRFTHSPAATHVFAKTGTHSAARALSGYITCASGRPVVFSILVNGTAAGSTYARDAIDKIVTAIYSAN